MPQLDKFIFFSQLFWLALFLGFLYLLLVGWFLPRLLRSLKFRRVYRGRLARLAETGGQRLGRMLLPLIAPIGRSVPLLVSSLDRPLAATSSAQLGFRRWFLAAPPIRPFPPRAGFFFGGAATPPAVPTFPVFWSAALPPSVSRLLPLLFRSSWMALPPPPRHPLSPHLLLSLSDTLVALPASAALLALVLVQRLVHWELFLWLDPLVGPFPLGEFGLPSLGRLSHPPLVHVPSLL